jgi:hypothetical protein
MSKVGVDQPALGPIDRFGQRSVTDPFLALKAPEAFRSENPQVVPRTQ